MSSLSSFQRWRQLGELSDIKGVCGQSGSAYQVSESLHVSYSSGVNLSGRFSSRAQG